MEETTAILRSCWLFQGLTDTELQQVLDCIPSRRQSYDKGEILFHTGDAFPQAGIVLRGGLHIFREDFWGNQMILSDCCPGDVFGEVFACPTAQRMFPPVPWRRPRFYIWMSRTCLRYVPMPVHFIPG